MKIKHSFDVEIRKYQKGFEAGYNTAYEEMGKSLYPRKKVYDLVRLAYLDGKVGKPETAVRTWSRKIEKLWREV